MNVITILLIALTITVSLNAIKLLSQFIIGVLSALLAAAIALTLISTAALYLIRWIFTESSLMILGKFRIKEIDKWSKTKIPNITELYRIIPNRTKPLRIPPNLFKPLRIPPILFQYSSAYCYIIFHYRFFIKRKRVLRHVLRFLFFYTTFSRKSYLNN